MARTNRRDVLADGEIQVLHCINRCARRAFLCGQDEFTEKDYEHRREFIRDRLEFLAGVMRIEVLGYAVQCRCTWNRCLSVLRFRRISGWIVC